MNKLSSNTMYGEKLLFETKNEIEMANYLFDNNFYSPTLFSTIGVSFKLLLESGHSFKDKEIISFIEEVLPEKTSEYKKSLESDKGFFKKKLIKMGLVEETAIKYVKRKL